MILDHVKLVISPVQLAEVIKLDEKITTIQRDFPGANWELIMDELCNDENSSDQEVLDYLKEQDHSGNDQAFIAMIELRWEILKYGLYISIEL